MDEHGEYLKVEFAEKIVSPQGSSREDCESKDFLVRSIKDFAIRVHAVCITPRISSHWFS